MPGFAPEMVEGVHLAVHPLTLRLCGLREPAGGMDAKNSVYHWAAAALVRGRAGLGEGTDACVADPAVRAMRGRIDATADDTVAVDSARLSVRRRDGSAAEIVVPHARGSADRPMSDAEIDGKFLAQAEGVLGAESAGSLLAACRQLGRSRHLGADLSRAFVWDGGRGRGTAA